MEKTKSNNVFSNEYDTPHRTMPFNRIRFEHYEEAFMEGIRRDDEIIGKTVGDPKEPTFENAIAHVDISRGEYYYDLLDRMSTVFSCMLSAKTNDKLDELAQKLSPILTKHANDVMLSKRLFGRVKHVCEHHRELTPEERVLLEKSYNGFVCSGVLLDDGGKDHLRKLTEKAGVLLLQFSQNLLKENKAYTLHITDEKQLDRLPKTACEAAVLTAKERNLDGWMFALDMPSYSPFMIYATQRDLRRQMYMARNTVHTHQSDENNLAICRRLINLRRGIAQLLGYDMYADYVLKHRMTSKIKNVYQLLSDLIATYKPTALEEREALSEIAKRQEGADFMMEPWDTAYYNHQLQMEKHSLDAEMLRPYFKLENVIKDIFGLVTRLCGTAFKENKNIPVHHPGVKVYEVSDSDGSYLAVLYIDFFPRKGRQSGAWMTEFRGQWIDHKENSVRPHASLVMNFAKPADDKPALLTLGEVETFLHEFGHSLHGMFANTRSESLSGTNVWWDFVELPSQLMEDFTVKRGFLQIFAFHYKTGEVTPDELVDRIVRSHSFMVDMACLRQVSFELLDMAYYTQRKASDEDIIPSEKKAWERAILDKQLPETYMTMQFSHIVAGGYAADYYSCKWAEVLDASAFNAFKRNGIFDQATTQRSHDCILLKGGTEHPMTLYRRFRGQEPTVDALLECSGIKRGQRETRLS